MSSASGTLGYVSGSSNQVVVTGTNSLWTNSGSLYVGDRASGNRLLVGNGGVVANGTGYLGYNSTASNNVAVVTGAGSLWSNRFSFSVGESGSGNRLVVSNGGTVANGFGFLGFGPIASNNVAVVTGTNSRWINSSDLSVGTRGSGNQLVVSNGGTVSASNVFVGLDADSLGNRVIVDGGTLRVTNVGGSAALDIRRGTNVLNAGLIEADWLVMNNSAGFFTFNGGTFNVGSATVSNGAPFTVGNGTSNAALNFTGDGTRTFGNGLVISSNATVSFAAGVLNSSATTNRNGQSFVVGNGTSNAAFNLTGTNSHSFASGLVINTNATLTGNGTISGNVTNRGTISAGNSAGSLKINGSLSLAASAGMFFEIGGLLATNQYDQVNVTNFVQFAGTLSLTLINGFTPASSDTFTLMTFASRTSTFANATNNAVLLTANQQRQFTVTYSATNLVVGNFQAASNLIFSLTAVIPAANQVTVKFESVAGQSYQLQYSSTLTNWTDATSPPLTNLLTGITTWIDDGTFTGGSLPAARFYRVRLVP